MAAASTPMETEVKAGRVTIGKRVKSIRIAKKAIPTVTISNKAAASPANTGRRPNSAGSDTTKGSNGKKKQTPLQKSIETARSVVANPRHPKHNDVKTLLESHQKKFVSDARFVELLKNLLF